VKREDIKVCVLRVGGTNCDAETKRSFKELGVQAEIVHVNELVKHRSLMEYSALVFPGGFSYGDYVRAGAIWAKWILAKLGKELKAFVQGKVCIYTWNSSRKGFADASCPFRGQIYVRQRRREAVFGKAL